MTSRNIIPKPQEWAEDDYFNPYVGKSTRKSTFGKGSEDQTSSLDQKDEDYFSDMEEMPEDKCLPIVFNSCKYKYTKSIINCR